MVTRRSRAFWWIGGPLIVLALLVLGATYLLLQTRPGHEFLLRAALERAAGAVDGELEVRGIRSDGLLRGFTLTGVAIRDAEGRPFVEADSVQVGYSVRELVGRRIALRPARIWNPTITVETLHGETRTNVERIFTRPDEPEGPPAERTLTLSLSRSEIIGGHLTVRLPLEGDPLPGTRGEPLADGGPDDPGLYQVLRFTGIEAFIQEARIMDPELEGERFQVRRLALEGHVLAEPFQLEDFRGEIRRRDSRLVVDAQRLWFPGSELSGVASLGWGDPDRALSLDAAMAADPFRLEDFRWLDSELPAGEGRFDVRVEGPLNEGRWRFRSADLSVGGSRVRGSVGFDLGDGVRLAETNLELLPLELRDLDPWLPEPLPVQGRLRGTVRAAGPLANLEVTGRLAFDDPARRIPASTAELDGILHLEGTPGATRLSVDVEDLRYPTLRAFLPDHPLVGEGHLRITASGRLPTGLYLTADVEHRSGRDEETSRVSATGSVRQAGDELVLALGGTVAPLSFDGVSAGLGRELPLSGVVRGPVRVDGPLSDLQVSGTLETPAGSLTARAVFDAREPARRYELDATVEDFRLGVLLPDLPDPTTVTGNVFLEGAGWEPGALEGIARVHLEASRVGGVEVERLETFLEARDGRLLVERLEFQSPLGRLAGTGDLALREGAPEGEVAMSWEVESLSDLRPLLTDQAEILPDTLTTLDRESLRMQGIDPDTLRAAMPLGGSARGTLNLRGGLADLRGDGFAEVREALVGEAFLAEGRVDFLGGRSDDGAWWTEGVLDVDRLDYGWYSLLRASAEVRYEPGQGTVRMDLQRDARESYRLRAGVSHDSVGVDVALESLVMELDGAEWLLEDPTRFRVEGRTVRLDDVRIQRPATDGLARVRMEAGGSLNMDGVSDLRMVFEGIELDRVGRMARLERFPSGVMDLELELRGEAENPSIDGAFQVREFSFDGADLSRVEGTLEFSDRLLSGSVEADHEGRQLLAGEVSVPVDLSFRRPVEDRFLDRRLEASVIVEDFPAGTALAFLDALEDVEGTLAGRIELRGTPQDLRPSGELRLRGGAMSLTELGLRPTGIDADLILREDQVVEISAQGRSRGSARIEGTLSLADPTDPDFDLRIALSGFQAVDRRDLNVRLGGAVTLNGRYRAPRVGGEVRVEQGTLFLEEFARTAQVVDLADPAFRDVVDTTVVAGRPRVETTENPFLQGLFVEVDLVLQRDVWIRSREMNVEIGGELIVTFDRPTRELLLVGTLEAVRGSYVQFGRTFQVEQGTVDFVGTPGINPALNIRAVNRLRQIEGEPLNVIAHLEGTLERPRVSLTSDAEPPMPESDLISYLLFGRPSFMLASGERDFLQGAAVQMGVGTVATQLGAVVARELGLDYFAVTQAQQPRTGPASVVGDAVAQTQVEVGQYVGQNLFVAIMLRPLTGLGASASHIPGARVEWRFSDFWTLEAFSEDRFARQGLGFGELGFTLDKVFGLGIFRDWSY